MIRRHRIATYINAVILTLLAGYFFLAPTVLLLSDLNDPALQNAEVPSIAWRLHRRLTERMARWAPERVRSKRAAAVDRENVPGTEWPIFGCVFYLWATEALQAEALRHPSAHPVPPVKYAREAIEAAAALISDPNHAEWVRKHWGRDYLKSENLFYRSLLIGGLTSYENLRGDQQYRALLTSQVESLADELDRSPHGLLDDYPGQCYPVDIVTAIAAIRRADALLGTDHAPFVARSVRGFSGSRLDPKTQLPAYAANAVTGEGSGPARGVGLSFMLTWAPALWPEVAREWYRGYERHFWQESFFLAGMRDFPAGSHVPDWFMEVDAGPILAGFGTTASAFGIGAARTNGRFDQASAVTGEGLVASWPLPDGTLLGARLFSSLSEAPYVGESILLFNFTRQPAATTTIVRGGRFPFIVPVAVGIYFLIGALVTWESFRKVRFALKTPVESVVVARFDWQWWTWLGLLFTGLAMAIQVNLFVGLALLLLAQFLPRKPLVRTQSRRNHSQDWAL